MKGSADFFPRAAPSRLGHGAGLHLGESRGAGSHRDGRLGREVRDHDEPFLLDRRHPGDGLPRALHDAVLLRLEVPVGPGVPEDAVRRKDPGLQRTLLCLHDVFRRGISLYALAKLLELLLGWNFDLSVCLRGIVLVYIGLGGLTSAIYNEVLQFFMIVFGFAPLAWLGLQDVGGWKVLKESSWWWPRRSILRRAPGGVLAGLGAPAANPMGVEWFGLAMGLGFVLSFGYWCTDFLVSSGRWRPIRCRRHGAPR